MTNPSLELTLSERAIGHIRTGPLRAGSLIAAYLLGGMVYYSDKFFGRNLLPPRDSLPEPIDIGEHYGNVPDSIAIGGLSSLIACGFLRLASSPDRVRRVALYTSISLGALANLASETVIGQRIFDFQAIVQTPGYTPNQDIIDFTVGTTTAALTALAVVKPQNHSFVKDAFNKHIQQPANTESPAANS